MNTDLSSEETTLVATYSSRHDAEIARSFLEEHNIHSFVVADDVHVPLQITEGARVYVFEDEAQNAHDALVGADLLPRRLSEAEEYDTIDPIEGDVNSIRWAVVGVIVIAIFSVLALMVYFYR